MGNGEESEFVVDEIMDGIESRKRAVSASASRNSTAATGPAPGPAPVPGAGPGPGAPKGVKDDAEVGGGTIVGEVDGGGCWPAGLCAMALTMRATMGSSLPRMLLLSMNTRQGDRPFVCFFGGREERGAFATK